MKLDYKALKARQHELKDAILLDVYLRVHRSLS